MVSGLLTKGIHGGICNRSTCNNYNALFYHFATHKYYCAECAASLNSINEHDAAALYKGPLCIEGISISDAIAFGYTHWGYSGRDEQVVHKISKITQSDFDYAKEYKEGEIVVCQIKPLKYSLGEDTIMDLVTEYIMDQEDVADEDGVLADLAAEADFKTLTDDINDRMSSRSWYELSTLRLLNTLSHEN